MNPFLAAVLRIAQQHYGGRPNARWLAQMAQNPEAQTGIGRRFMNNLGVSTPEGIAAMNSKNYANPTIGLMG